MPDELNNPWSQVGSEVGEGGYWEHDDETFETYFDIRDQVTRCQKCGHEVWSAHIGFCTGCNAGRSGSLYYEIIPPGKLRLQIEAHENAHEFVDPENGDQVSTTLLINFLFAWKFQYRLADYSVLLVAFQGIAFPSSAGKA